MSKLLSPCHLFTNEEKQNKPEKKEKSRKVTSYYQGYSYSDDSSYIFIFTLSFECSINQPVNIKYINNLTGLLIFPQKSRLYYNEESFITYI